MRAGLLGEKLPYSFSPRIHSLLGDYSYELFEIERDRLDAFLKSDRFDALNVTIPYKKAVIPYCAELSSAAKGIGSVNTLVRRADGSLWGDNTDAAGFEGMLRFLGVDPTGKKALVLGSGGVSLTVVHVLRKLGTSDIIVVSRKGENNYENLSRHADAQILVNATPVGMYPNTDLSPVDLSRLPNLEAVLDLVYNPAHTKLLMDAEARGIPCLNGLYMLVEQARKASMRFTAAEIPETRTDEIRKMLASETLNLVLIGMPGCGKTTLGQLLAERMHRKFVDADEVLVQKIGMTIPEYFAAHSEAEFRMIETEVLRQIGRESGLVIATGGGCVTRAENRALLRQNGLLFFIERALPLLATEGRPLSEHAKLEEMYSKRLGLYQAFADRTVQNTDAPEKCASEILEEFYEISGC